MNQNGHRRKEKIRERGEKDTTKQPERGKGERERVKKKTTRREEEETR